MATRLESKYRNTQKSAVLRQANSPASSTTSSSRQFPETSVDGLSSPASSSARSKLPQFVVSEASILEAERSTENVTVTVRFRPLSPREIRQGEEIAWYADGDTTVRNEHNPSIAYAYDRVFGPTTTTRHVYDVAAQHVVGGAMEGVNGTIFAYGVTSSGKTHTMHGDQRSPGVIALAVKDAFGFIQETPSREFLLRVSYLEIYNEVVNDLLNPAGQNLRIREDSQGTFVEGIKEEVVLSPAHALSLIAAGEEECTLRQTLMYDRIQVHPILLELLPSENFQDLFAVKHYCSIVWLIRTEGHFHLRILVHHITLSLRFHVQIDGRLILVDERGKGPRRAVCAGMEIGKNNVRGNHELSSKKTKTMN